MRVTTATISEIKAGNKRFCLSALRVSHRCFQCCYYETCESKFINTKYDALQQKLRETREKFDREIQKQKGEISSL